MDQLLKSSDKQVSIILITQQQITTNQEEIPVLIEWNVFFYFWFVFKKMCNSLAIRRSADNLYCS